VFAAVMRVKSMYDKIVIETQEIKRKYGNRRNFYTHLHLKDGLGMEFAAF